MHMIPTQTQTQQFQALVELAWSAINPAQDKAVLSFYNRTDIDCENCLIIALNGVNQLKIYPIEGDWAGIEIHGWSPKLNSWVFAANYSDLKMAAANVVIGLMKLLIMQEFDQAKV